MVEMSFFATGSRGYLQTSSVNMLPTWRVCGLSAKRKAIVRLMICVVLPYDTDFVLFSLDILILCICFVLILHHNDHHFCRVTTCLENLEMSGNLTAVREKILSGKSCLKLFIVSCMFAFILDFAELERCILVSNHALLHSSPTTDNNTSTSMISVTLNMGRSAVNRQGIVRELHIVWRVVTLFLL